MSRTSNVLSQCKKKTAFNHYWSSTDIVFPPIDHHEEKTINVHRRVATKLVVCSLRLIFGLNNRC